MRKLSDCHCETNIWRTEQRRHWIGTACSRIEHLNHLYYYFREKISQILDIRIEMTSKPLRIVNRALYSMTRHTSLGNINKGDTFFPKTYNAHLETVTKCFVSFSNTSFDITIGFTCVSNSTQIRKRTCQRWSSIVPYFLYWKQFQ